MFKTLLILSLLAVAISSRSAHVLEIQDSTQREVSRVGLLEGTSATVDVSLNGQKVSLRISVERADDDDAILVSIGDSDEADGVRGAIRLDESLSADVAGGIFVKYVRRSK